MNGRRSQLFFGFAKLFLFFAVAVAMVLSTVLLSKWMKESTAKKVLPVVSIALNNVDLKTVHAGTKDIKYPGNYVAVVDNGEQVEYEKVELKGRGNSTWGWEKSPYQLKLDEKQEFLGMGAAKKWIFLANYFDMSNLRTAVAFKLESLLGQDYALKGHFAELVINDDWRGVYYVTQKIGVGKTRVNLKNENGVIVELENLHPDGEDCYFTASGSCLVVKDSVEEDNEKEAMKDFVEKFNAFERAARARDYSAVAEVMDTESLAKYYLLSEFTSNPDSFVSSWYFYQDGADDIIHVGPGWDFDYALGNKMWAVAYGDNYYSPESDFLRIKTLGGEIYDPDTNEVTKIESDPENAHLVYYLLETSEFSDLVAKTYEKHLFGRKAELMMHLMTQAGLIREAAISDISKYEDARGTLWYVLGKKVYSGFEAEDDIDYAPAYIYDTEVDYLIDWVSRRFDYLDYKYMTNRGKMVIVI